MRVHPLQHTRSTRFVLPREDAIHDTGKVEGYCTCGARLVEDARFCHRCARPVREDDPLLTGAVTAEEDAPESVEADTVALSGEAVERPVVEVPHVEVSFRSPLAVRISFLSASLVQLILMLVAVAKMAFTLPFILAAGGVYSVFLFARRSGQSLTAGEGARLGWITGVLGFVISTVLFTAGMLTSEKSIVANFEENVRNSGLDSQMTAQVLEMLKDPQMVTIFVLLVLVFNFILIAALSSLGGALGSKLTRRP